MTLSPVLLVMGVLSTVVAGWQVWHVETRVSVRGGVAKSAGRLLSSPLAGAWLERRFIARTLAAGAALLLAGATSAFAQTTEQPVGEANLQLPDFSQVKFLGIGGHELLLFGILFCVFGLLFV